MNLVFLDTVGILALWDSADQWHPQADAAYSLLQAAKTPLLTSSYILLECGNASARRPYRSRVTMLRQALMDNGTLVEPTEQDCELAWEAFQRGEAGYAGIVDHVSFVLMRRLGLMEVFTNDAHFRAAGFRILF